MMGRTDFVYDYSHLVKLFRADIRTVCEAELNRERLNLNGRTFEQGTALELTYTKLNFPSRS